MDRPGHSNQSTFRVQQTILLVNTRTPGNYLQLSLCLSFDILVSPLTPIEVDTSKIYTLTEHLYDDILTLAGILPVGKHETAVFNALCKIKVKNTRYRVIIVERDEEILNQAMEFAKTPENDGDNTALASEYF